MLAKPLIARGVSTKYITSGNRPIVDDLIAGECACPSNSNFEYSFELILTVNEAMLGVKQTEAGTDLAVGKYKKHGPAKKGTTEYEEWNGIAA